MAEVLVIFYSDNPITQRDEDVLGRGKFAENVAKAITAYNGNECLTIGIFGGWGNGKTSLSNMILSELLKEKCAVIKFNPWMYSNTEDLLFKIFDDIADKIQVSNINGIVSKAATAIEKIGSLAELGACVPGIGGEAAIISTLFKSYASILKGKEDNEKDLTAIKNEIADCPKTI